MLVFQSLVAVQSGTLQQVCGGRSRGSESCLEAWWGRVELTGCTGSAWGQVGCPVGSMKRHLGTKGCTV